MRLGIQTLILGAATSALASDQVILGGGLKETAASTWEAIQEAITGAGDQAQALWDEVTLLAPDAVAAFKQAALAQRPKAASRRPESEWDHVVKGAVVNQLWATQSEEKGASSRSLNAYDLRVKKVNPAALGVDSVKQYSGYLDDNENDKHLFYCEFSSPTFTFPAALGSGIRC
jgi:cathepsin A (carboxypeptidase C)